MAASTTPSITWLLSKLRRDFPEVDFVAGDAFAWDPINHVITYQADSPDLAALLHEVAHHQLGHMTYNTDIELIGIERDTWLQARQLAKRYGLSISDEVIDAAMDTYRDWLHARATCPRCRTVGIQYAAKTYQCLACEQFWLVNDGRAHQLRRYTY